MIVILPLPAASRSSSSWCLPRHHVQPHQSTPDAMDVGRVQPRPWAAHQAHSHLRVSWAFSSLLYVRCKIRRVSYPSDLKTHMQQSDQAYRRAWPGPSRRSALHVLHSVLPPADRVGRGPRNPAPSRALAVIKVRISLMHVWWVGGGG